MTAKIYLLLVLELEHMHVNVYKEKNALKLAHGAPPFAPQ
jgi:hypothetical protein